MNRILLLCVLLALPCVAAASHLDTFERRPMRLALFAQDEPAPSKPELEPFALAFWLTPFLRVAGRPDAAGPGIGAEGAYFLSKRTALTASFSLYSLLADVRTDDDRFGDEEDANGFEATFGVRWRFFSYDRGALYVEFRATYASYGGSGPIRTTQSLGPGAHFGYEFGGPIVRGYLESGFTYLAALNYSNVGWLFNGESNGGGGLHIEVIRVGIRIYV